MFISFNLLVLQNGKNLSWLFWFHLILDCIYKPLPLTFCSVLPVVSFMQAYRTEACFFPLTSYTRLKVMTQVSSSFTRKVLLRADGFSPAAVPIFKLRRSHPLSVILGENTALRGFDYFLANCDKTLKAHLVYFLFQIWSLPFFQEALVSFWWEMVY